MSLQSDFERCLEYAKALESAKEQQAQAQNGIVFMQNESEQLKKKVRICTVISLVAIAFLFIVAWSAVFDVGKKGLIDFIVPAVIPITALIVSVYNRIKTKKEICAFESQKPAMIQKYTEEAEACENEIRDLVEEIYREDLLDIVPADYFSVAAIGFCLDRVYKKMATTAAEAFRQLEAEIKHLEQMEYLEQMNEARMAQLNDIKRAIEVNTLVSLAWQNKNNS